MLATSVCDLDGDRNIELSIDDRKIEFKISKKHLFRTLEHRKEIVGIINKKLDELVEEYISKTADNQEKAIKEL